MTLAEKRESLRRAVDDLKEVVLDITSEERQNRLIDVGFAAAAVDVAALEHPEAEAIKKETDALVNDAERVVEAFEDRDLLNQSLPTRVREIAKKRKM